MKITSFLTESELILNPDGSIYHLHLRPEDIAETIILVGDQDRVAKVSQYFDILEFQMRKREFVTHTGKMGKKRLTVISSGIGTDNVEILMNELDALVNIDLEKRQIKPENERVSLQMIRIGTSGSLKEDIPIDSLVVSQNAVGLDSLMNFYSLFQTQTEQNVAQKMQENLSLHFTPYCLLSNGNSLSEKLASDFMQGNTLTCPGFYAPQGRTLRMNLKNQQYLGNLQNFHHPQLPNGFTNFEMETAAYYAFGRILGHQIISLNVILANRITHQFSRNPEKSIDKLIQNTLERLTSSN